MKSRFACVLAALLLLAGFACGEGAQDFWTHNTDLYYHMNENCAGVRGMVPISQKAARAFAKHACPVCIPAEDEGADVQAAARGGTIVVRFSDAWLQSHALTGVFGWSPDDQYRGDEAWQRLGEYLHGDAYNAFLADYFAGGSAEARASKPHILGTNGTLIMNERHIGSDWYIVVRPKEKFRNQWDMYWRVNSLQIGMEGGVLRSNFDMQTVEETREIKIDGMNGSEAVFSHSGDDIEIQVYEALEGNIAVIRERNANAAQMENVRLVIGGVQTGAELSGYADGDAAVYCCMLTDGELGALKGNARAELWHVEQVNSAAYRVDTGSAYVYHSAAEDGGVFSFDKENGSDPADHAFRLILNGEPMCFAVRRNGAPVLCDYTGKVFEAAASQEGESAERITPLLWNGEKGVFLAEQHDYVDYGADDRLFESGMIYGVRFGSDPEDEWGSYLCWLVDETGELIGESRNQAFTIFENGKIHMESLTGETFVYDPLAD